MSGPRGKGRDRSGSGDSEEGPVSVTDEPQHLLSPARPLFVRVKDGRVGQEPDSFLSVTPAYTRPCYHGSVTTTLRTQVEEGRWRTSGKVDDSNDSVCGQGRGDFCGP